MSATRKIRVLFFFPSISTGGAERQALLLARNLDRARFTPIVWTFPPAGVMAELFEQANIEVRAKEIRIDTSGEIDMAVSWLASIKADIYYSYGSMDGWEDILLARLAGIRVCISKRGNTRWWDEGAAVRLGERVRNTETDAVVANCHAVAKQVVGVEGVSPERVFTIENAVVPPARPRREPRSPVIGFVANYRPQKGHDLILAAFQELANAEPNARLLLVGRTGGGLETLVAERPHRDRIEMLGEVLDTPAAYRRMTIYVHTSRTEGMCGAVMEAMSHGLPVVATDVGGTAEVVVHGETGFVVPSGDRNAIKDAALELLRNPRLRKRMGDAGRRRIREHFSVERYVGRYQELFTNLHARAASAS